MRLPVALVVVLVLTGCAGRGIPSAKEPLPPQPGMTLSCDEPCGRSLLPAGPKTFEPTLAAFDGGLLMAVSRFEADPLAVGARAQELWRSTDAGLTWTRTWTSDGWRAAGNPFAACTVVGDPVAAAGTRLLAGGLAANPGLAGGAIPWVVASDDGGASWGAPVAVARGTPDCVAPPAPGDSVADKPVLAARGDVAFMAWRNAQAAPGLPATLHIAASRDAGRTWALSEVGSLGGASPGSALVAPDGTWWLAASDLDGGHVLLAMSADQGGAWTVTDLGRTANPFPAVAWNGSAVVAFSREGGGERDPALAWPGHEPLALANASGVYPHVAAEAVGTAIVVAATVGTGAALERQAWMVQDGQVVGSVTLGPVEVTGTGVTAYGDYFGMAQVAGGAFTVWGCGPADAAQVCGGLLRLTST